MSDRSREQAEPETATVSCSRAGAGSRPAPSAWPRHLALATLLAAVPLIFFGGTVTTLHAGLAIDGWLILEPGRGDWFLWAYPVEQWFRDLGTFVEHTHRLLGSLVGLLAIATVIATFAADRRSVAFKLASAALLCVILQGVLGGLRVLEKSEDLAFVHAAFGQLTFALLCASVIATRPGWMRASNAPPELGGSLWSLSLLAVGAVYAEILVGAWLRHGGATAALFLHVLLVIGVVLCVMLLARELGRRAAELGQPRVLRTLRRALLSALGLQIALGLLAFLSVYVFVGKNPGTVEQSLFPTLHVMGGALLLSTSVAALLWSRKIPSGVETHQRARVGRGTLTRAELGGAP